MSQIELEKIADHFDRDQDGYIDLSEINSILRGIRRARSIAKKPVSDSEKIDHEVSVENVTKFCNILVMYTYVTHLGYALYTYMYIHISALPYGFRVCIIL